MMSTSIEIDSADAQSAIAGEQMQVIYTNQLSSLPTNSLLALTIATIVWTDVNHALLCSWIAMATVFNVARLIVAIRRLRNPVVTPRAMQIQAFSSFLAGSIWSVVPIFMLTLSNGHAPLVLFIICGITAGAAIQSSCSAMCATAFVLPVMASISVKVLVDQGEGAILLACSAGIFVVLIFLASRRGEESFVNTIRLRLQATVLASSLDREHNAAKAAAQRLYFLANHDSLTGLVNRSSFSSQLEVCLGEARASNAPFGLFLLDLDHFKSVNDTLGHSAGDQVLKQTASRLISALGPDHVVARLGGDEFALIYREPTDARNFADSAERVAARILEKVSGVFLIGEHAVSLGLSIGLAIFPDDGTTAENLLAHADLALYGAKDGGRHRWRRFDEALLAQATIAHDIEHDLPLALAQGALQVVYQPQIALSDRRLIGLEALLRWQHPIHGWISPPLVVAAALRIRQSQALTGYVLDNACRQIHRMGELGYPGILVAVNVSPSELDQYELPQLVSRAIERHGIGPGQLEVEITEEAFAANENALATLTALAAIGVRVAIDDFGTGCSALAYLRSMRVDRIKIDRSFVTGLAGRAGDRILVQAILGLGRSFGIEVLAEGVETEDDVSVLEAFGCNAVQGYHFARPLSQADLVSWLASREPGQAGFRGHPIGCDQELSKQLVAAA